MTEGSQEVFAETTPEEEDPLEAVLPQDEQESAAPDSTASPQE